MLFTPASELREKNIESYKCFLKRDSFTVTELSSLIGTLTSTVGTLTKSWISVKPCAKKSKGQFWHTY